MLTSFRKKFKHFRLKRVSKNPFFYFGLVSFVLFGLLFTSSDSLAQLTNSHVNNAAFFNPFFKDTNNLASSDLFVGQDNQLAYETPDLNIQDNSIHAATTPDVLTTQTLGDIFGGQQGQRKDVQDYTVQVGDTVQSVAESFSITPQTVAWANNISVNTSLKVGQTLAILPVSGVLYIVKSGDTLDQIIKNHSDKTHLVNMDEVAAFNNLASIQDLSIGDILTLPGGIELPKSAPVLFAQIVLPGSTFISPFGPALFRVTQGLHYFNAVDIQSLNGAGSPVYAMAAGIVQRASYDRVGGNRVTIAHSNGVVTYYGHLSAMMVKPGDAVYMGQQIGTEGQTGQATGPHVHLEVIGAKNPYAGISVGTILNGK